MNMAAVRTVWSPNSVSIVPLLPPLFGDLGFTTAPLCLHHVTSWLLAIYLKCKITPLFYHLQDFHHTHLKYPTCLLSQFLLYLCCHHLIPNNSFIHLLPSTHQYACTHTGVTFVFLEGTAIISKISLKIKLLLICNPTDQLALADSSTNALIDLFIEPISIWHLKLIENNRFQRNMHAGWFE